MQASCEEPNKLCWTVADRRSEGNLHDAAPDHSKLLCPGVVHGHLLRLQCLSLKLPHELPCQSLGGLALVLLHDLTSLHQIGVDLAVAQCTMQQEMPGIFSKPERTLLIISGSRSKESGTWNPASFIAFSVQDARKPFTGILDLGKGLVFGCCSLHVAAGLGSQGCLVSALRKKYAHAPAHQRVRTAPAHKQQTATASLRCSQRLKRLRGEARGTSAHAPGYDWLGDSALLHGLTFRTTTV